MILKNLILIIIIIILIQKINKFEFKNHRSNCSKIDKLLINDRKPTKRKKVYENDDNDEQVDFKSKYKRSPSKKKNCFILIIINKVFFIYNSIIQLINWFSLNDFNIN